MRRPPGAGVARADRVEDDMGKEVVEIVTDELLGLHVSGTQ